MVELVFQFNQQVCENTLYFFKSLGYDPADLTELGDLMVTWWRTNMRPFVSDACVLNIVRVTDLTTQNAPGIEIPVTTNNVGQNTSPAMPGNVTVATTFLTGFRGRSWRGRNYFVGMTEGQVIGNFISTALQTSLTAAYAALLTAPIAPTYVWSTVSRYGDNQPRNPGFSAIITSTKTDLAVDSQRRRLFARGK